MSMTTYDAGASRAELEMVMRAAVRGADPIEQGREQAGRVTSSLLRGLMLVAGIIALYNIFLLTTRW